MRQSILLIQEWTPPMTRRIESIYESNTVQEWLKASAYVAGGYQRLEVALQLLSWWDDEMKMGYSLSSILDLEQEQFDEIVTALWKVSVDRKDRGFGLEPCRSRIRASMLGRKNPSLESEMRDEVKDNYEEIG